MGQYFIRFMITIRTGLLSATILFWTALSVSGADLCANQLVTRVVDSYGRDQRVLGLVSNQGRSPENMWSREKMIETLMLDLQSPTHFGTPVIAEIDLEGRFPEGYAETLYSQIQGSSAPPEQKYFLYKDDGLGPFGVSSFGYEFLNDAQTVEPLFQLFSEVTAELNRLAPEDERGRLEVSVLRLSFSDGSLNQIGNEFHADDNQYFSGVLLLNQHSEDPFQYWLRPAPTGGGPVNEHWGINQYHGPNISNAVLMTGQVNRLYLINGTRVTDGYVERDTRMVWHKAGYGDRGYPRLGVVCFWKRAEVK